MVTQVLPLLNYVPCDLPRYENANEGFFDIVGRSQTNHTTDGLLMIYIPTATGSGMMYEEILAVWSRTLSRQSG